MEASVGERQRSELVAHDLLVRVCHPAEAAEIDRLAGHERPRVVAELELEPRRRNAVRGRDADADGERLAGEELQPVLALAPEQRGGGDRRLAGSPLAKARAALGGVDLV